MSTQTPTKRFRIRPSRIIAGFAAIVVALIWVFPVYWMISSSLLPNVVLTSTTPRFFPYGGSFDNYGSVLSAGMKDGQWWTSNFMRAMGVSLSVTLISVFFALLFAFLAALAISRFKFRGRKSFVLAILFIQMLPAEGLFIAQYKMMSSLGEATHGLIGLNSIIGVSILYIAAVIPFTVWMLRGFVAGVPAELEESAQVDGCTPTGAFFRITFPLLAPGLVASGVYAFLQAWNEFTIALVILQKEDMRSLPLWLRTFIQGSQARETDWGAVMAASTLVAIPVIIFFLCVQGRLTSGLVAGAVKG
ncbi:MAG: carbohydrate ABC transporter permease [Propionibacteriaceae bacterium]|jgi:N,N'-diacetylchitobiose transport system permease protein|nr:carbohydrate ABC transporter permease [Propionibacteriaceae bacterium]